MLCTDAVHRSLESLIASHGPHDKVSDSAIFRATGDLGVLKLLSAVYRCDRDVGFRNETRADAGRIFTIGDQKVTTLCTEPT